MRKLLSLNASRLVVLWLVLAVSSVGVLELLGDCVFEGQTRSEATGVCMHGDSGRHADSPSPCSTDHHGATGCGCSCHTTGMLTAGVGLRNFFAVRLLTDPPRPSVPERRDSPSFRPPIRACPPSLS